jgi:hypothetical protein
LELAELESLFIFGSTGCECDGEERFDELLHVEERVNSDKYFRERERERKREKEREREREEIERERKNNQH